MTRSRRDEVREYIETKLNEIVSDDYIEDIVDCILNEVIEDIDETADIDFSEDDIKLAVGRILCRRLGAFY